MALTLVKDIVSDVINELSQVPGVATELYSAPIIKQFVQNAFLLEFEELFWSDYMMYFVVNCDGSTGRIDGDLVGPLGAVDDYGDVAIVWPGDSNRRLNELPPNMNPTSISGGQPVFMSPDYSIPHRPIRIWPQDATGQLIVWARQRPKLPLMLTDSVAIDRLLLTYDACWMYATDDGTVPAQVTKYEMLCTKRRTQCEARYMQQPLSLDPRIPSIELEGMTDGGWFVLDSDPLA